MMNNPYEGCGNPVTGERLVGRENIVTDIYNALVAGANYSIDGLHRIGKTSIGREVLLRIQKHHPEIRCASIAVGTYNSEIQFYKAIIKKLFPDAEKPFVPDPDDLWLDFQEYLGSQSQGKKCICILDELDMIIKRFEHPDLLITRLRDIAYNPSEYNTSFLFISARTLHSIEQKYGGSDLAGICNPKTIGPFRDKSCLEQMLKRGSLPESLAKPLFETTGGHPFWAEMLLRALVVKCQELQINVNDVNEELLQDVVAECYPTLVVQYEKLKTFLNDWGAESWGNTWEKFCDYILGLSFEPVDPHLLESLSEYGLIRRSVEEWGWAMSKHLQEYIERQRREYPVWTRIGEIEQMLRKLIRYTFKKELGDDWINNIKENEKFKTMFDELHKIMRREQKILQKDSVDILDFAYPGNLKELVLYKWDCFKLVSGKQVFGNSTPKFEEEMNAICNVRNPIAHHNFGYIKPDVKENAQRACRSILDQLNKCFKDNPELK